MQIAVPCLIAVHNRPDFLKFRQRVIKDFYNESFIIHISAFDCHRNVRLQFRQRGSETSEYHLYDDGRPYYASYVMLRWTFPSRLPTWIGLPMKRVRMDNCYAVNALSGPSRACIPTGKFSHINGFTDNASTFDGNQQTLP